MKLFIALLTGKLLRLFCRLLHRGGTAAPGRIAMKICPELLSRLSKNVRCLVITGSNGKSTCVRIAAKGLEEEGLSYFANFSGANLIEGIATEFIMNSSLSGKCRKEYALLETDELACKEVCRQLQPELIFVTNLFVDQVDRFGGVKGSFEGIKTGILNSPSSKLILNADDSVSALLGELPSGGVCYYGFSEAAALSCGYSGSSDVNECIICGGELEHSYMTFSHLGAFRCRSCGRAQPAADFLVEEILSSDFESSRLLLSFRGERKELKINLPALYNIYNGVGSFAALLSLGISEQSAASALSGFNCGFGRMEDFPSLGEKGGKMVLVKNGAGCDQVIQFLKGCGESFVLSIYLNNNVSDGVDISWIEGVDFEALRECSISRIYVSGMQLEAMFERLIKAGFDGSIIIKERDCSKLIAALKGSKDRVFILPTYTGMMAARSEIIKQCGGSEFWER